MVSKGIKITRCAAILTVLMFLMSALIPMAMGIGWLTLKVISTDQPLTFIDAGDVDRDGVEEAYAASFKGNIYEVRYTGNHYSSDEISSAPDNIMAMEIDDIGGDNYDEIYIASRHTTDNGRIYSLTNNGVSWSLDVIYNSFNPSDYPMDIEMGDGNNNHMKELYYLEAGGALNYLVKSGNSWFNFQIDKQYPGFFRSLAVGDGDDDGMNEVYVGTGTNKVLQYRYTMGVWTSTEMGYGGYSGYWDYIKDIIIGDPDEDGRTEVVAIAGDRAIMAFEKDQGVWLSDQIGTLSGIVGINSLAMGDSDNDGKEELFAAATNNIIYHYSFQSPTWVRNEISMSPLLNNVRDLVVMEMDGSPDFQEIYVPCENGMVYRLSKDVEPPEGPEVWSRTHVVHVWSNKTTIEMEWKVAYDASGICGFSYRWSSGIGAPTPPDEVIDLGADIYTLKTMGFADGPKIYFGIKAMDCAGNWGRASYYGPMSIDTVPPTNLSILINNDEKFTNSNIVDLDIHADDELSGIFNMSFSNDAHHWPDWVPYDKLYSGWDLNEFSPNGITDGPRWVYLRAQDIAGNVASGVADDIELDQSGPTDLQISINDGERYINTTQVSLHVSAVDPPGGSNLAYMSFSNDDRKWSPWELFDNEKPYWDLVNDAGGWDGDGEHKVYFRSQDLAGNIAGPVHTSITLDRVAPSRLVLVISSGNLVAKNTSLTFMPRAEDVPDHSGLGKMAFREYGEKWSDWEFWKSKVDFEISNGDGTKFIYYKVKDKAGNEADPVQAFIVLDTKTPRISHIRVIGVTDKNAVISWNTDIPANGVVTYGTSINYNGDKHHSDLSTTHSITLSGLRANTDYHFRVESSDVAGQSPTISRDMVFTTKGYPDTLPPAITELKVEGLSSTTAVISWKTNEPSDTRLKYGTTPQFGMVEGDSKDVLLHRVQLTDLEPATWYFFASISTDPRGNGPTEATDSFLTLSDPDVQPPTISNIKVIGITDSLAIVKWHTNEPSLSIVEYGLSHSYGTIALDEQYEAVHRMVLTGLQPDKTYHFIIRALDTEGNGPTTTYDHFFFTLRVSDHDVPVMTNVRAEGITSNSAIISWATDEPADSGVEYYSSDGVGESNYDLEMVESHSLHLTNLESDTDYNYRVVSYDASGNGPSVSSEFSFRTSNLTDSEMPEIFQIQVVGITDHLAVVLWSTNEETTGLVRFGLDQGNYSFMVEEEGFNQEHSVVLWGLDKGTVYHIIVESTDSSGNGPIISDDLSFRTLTDPDLSAPLITDVVVLNITFNGATIMWWTNEPANSTVVLDAGEDGRIVARDSRFTTLHTMVLQDLVDNTTYTFNVRSFDPSGNKEISADQSFTTEAHSLPPPPKPPIPPQPPNTPTSFMDAGPYMLFVILLIVVLSLTVYIYVKGGFSKRQGKKMGSSPVGATTRPLQHSTYITSGSAQMVPPPISDEGICPHCSSQISLTGAARRMVEDRKLKEEARRRKEESAHRRAKAVAKHQKRMEVIDRKVSSLSKGRSTPVRPVVGSAAIIEDPPVDNPDRPIPVAEPETHLDDELEDLYNEVEEEEDMDAGNLDDEEEPVWTPPSSPILAGISSGNPVPKPKKVTRVKARGTKKVPLKTVKCGNCDGRVPVFSRKRPLRITCPDCGRSGTLK